MTTVERGPLPRFAYEVAHQVREALLDPKVRKRAEKIARETIEKQWRLLDAESGPRASAVKKHFEWHRTGHKGEMPPLPARNVGATVAVDDWPFPVEHGVENAPGCVLVLAAINDYAVEYADLFRKTACEFTPLVSFQPGGPWAIFGWRWVDAVGNLTDKHANTLKVAIDRALKALGATVDPVRADRENFFPRGVPDDTDLVDAIVRLDSERTKDNTDIGILRAFVGESAPNDAKAKSLQGRIRKARGAGRTTLPPR